MIQIPEKTTERRRQWTEGRLPVLGAQSSVIGPPPGPVAEAVEPSAINAQRSTARVALLTGGGDKPYALGMAAALTSAGITVDFIGSDDLSVPELLSNTQVNFLNLRGDQASELGLLAKVLRVLNYYRKLLVYAAKARPKLFHILWNNKFELFDRTLLMLYYRMLGKKIVLTVHNVNAGKRDLNDSLLNRLSLRIQVQLVPSHFCPYRRNESRTCNRISHSESEGERHPFWD